MIYDRKGVCFIMGKKSLKQILSILLVFIITAASFAIGGIGADAAGTTFSVQIENVSRIYSESKEFFDMINDYRLKNNKPALIMDSTYLESSMIRAAEIALYDSDSSPNGSNGASYASGGSDSCQIRACDVLSLNELFTRFKNNGTDSYLLSSSYKSVGVGVVKVNGHRFLSILLSNKTPVEVKSSVYDQGTVRVNQTVEVLPEVISQFSSAYDGSYSIYSGSEFIPKIKVTNRTYPSVYVYLNSYNMEVTFTDPTVLKYNGSTALASAPGYCTVRMCYPSAMQISDSVTVKVVGISFDSCEFSGIPDQIYTGSPITPAVRIKDANGNYMKQGTDFTVTYQNNVKVGIATANITGIGSYGGEKRSINFNIISDGSQSGEYFNASIVTAANEISLGQNVRVTAKVTGGTSPFTYTFAYALYGTSNWKNFSYSTTRNYAFFKPAEAKLYYVRITVRDSKNKTSTSTAIVNVKAPFSLSVYATPKETVIGGSVKVKATTKGGISPVKYAFLVRKPGGSGWISLKDYSTDSYVAYRPKKEGVYTFYIKAKSGNGEYLSKFLNVKVTASTLANYSTVSAKSIDFGKAVVLKGAASGGKAPFYYTYMAKKSDWTNWYTLKGPVKDTSYTYRPSAAGDYNICIKVKDATGLEVTKYFDLKVYSKLTNKSKLSVTSTTPGTTVRVTGAAAGGKGPYTYAFYYKHQSESSFTRISSFSTTASGKFVPMKSGKFTVRTKVRDKTGNIVVKDLALSTYTTLKNNSRISASKVTAGKYVTVTCGASGGKTPYTYNITYKRPGASSFSGDTTFASVSQKKLKLSTKGVFVIRVIVKDRNSVLIVKDFKVTVS